MADDHPPPAIWHAQDARDAIARRHLRPRPIPRIGGTVADLLKHDSHLEVACLQPGCRNTTTLSAEDLARRYGEGRSLQAIVNAAICTKCGARGCHPSFTPRERPAGHGWGGMWGAPATGAGEG